MLIDEDRHMKKKTKKLWIHSFYNAFTIIASDIKYKLEIFFAKTLK